MNIKEILDHLLAGKKIRRARWVKNAFVRLDGDEILDEDGTDSYLSGSELLADDWEIVTEDEVAWDFNAAFDAIRVEYFRIIQLHPAPNPNLAVLMEEVGEVAKAYQEGNVDEVRTEAIQVAAVAFRIIVEGLGA